MVRQKWGKVRGIRPAIQETSSVAGLCLLEQDNIYNGSGQSGLKSWTGVQKVV